MFAYHNKHLFTTTVFSYAVHYKITMVINSTKGILFIVFVQLHEWKYYCNKVVHIIALTTMCAIESEGYM